MADVFFYNSGSLFQATPPGDLRPLTARPGSRTSTAAFKPAVTVTRPGLRRAVRRLRAGGVLYNKKIYERLNLEIPKTWDEFMANNAKIKAAGIDPVLQSYQDTWTSQLFVLGDFHNIAAADPEWADKYTEDQVKYAQEPAVEGFQHLRRSTRPGT